MLAAFPFFEIIYRFFYARSLRILRKSLKEIEGVHDVYLTSDIKSKDFVFGISDYNLFVLVKNHGHPKRTLREIRAKIKKSTTTSRIVNTDFIPTLTLNEFKVSRFKSYLLRNHSRDLIVWNSILHKDKTIKINTNNTTTYPLIYSAIQDLDHGLFKEDNGKSKRTLVKNISRGLRALDKYFSKDFKIKKKYFQRAKIYLRYPSLLSFSYKTFLLKSWGEILQPANVTPKDNQRELKIPMDLKKALDNILQFRFIDDITLTPSLIQLNPEKVTGKLYIEVHVNEAFLRPKLFDKRSRIRSEIESHQTEDLKFRIRFVSSHLHVFKQTIMATPFPLDNLYRKEACYSLKNLKYSYGLDHNYLNEAAINFFIIQFMRFRSSKQKTDLIGSKYIKSLNLMYRFYLLSYYLEHRKVEFTSDINEVKELLSPQFANVDPLQTVEEDDWKIIRAQLIHFLKKIRSQLVRHDKSLTHLRF